MNVFKSGRKESVSKHTQHQQQRETSAEPETESKEEREGTSGGITTTTSPPPSPPRNQDIAKFLKAYTLSVTSADDLAKVVPQLQITKNFCSTVESKQQSDAWGNTPLHYAALFGQLQCIRFLLEKGHKLDQKNNKGETPLFMACSQPSPFHQACADLLVRAGSKVNAKNVRKETPLINAIRRGKISFGKSSNQAIIQFLVTWGADTNSKDTEGRTALHHSSMEGLLGVSNLLIQKGSANVNVKDNVKQMTPLHLAIVKDRYEVCRLLLLRGADISLMCSEGSVLHLCASYPIFVDLKLTVIQKQTELFTLLFQRDPKGNIRAMALIMSGQTCLVSACVSGNLDCLQTLLYHIETLREHIKFPLEQEHDWLGNKALQYAHLLHADRACVEYCSSCSAFTWGTTDEIKDVFFALSNNYLGLINSDEFADCSFVVEGNVYRGHKLFFVRVLPEKLIEESASTLTISSSTFQALCHYVYSGLLPSDHQILKELLTFTQSYSLPLFSKRIEDAMLRKGGSTSPLPHFLRAMLRGAWSDCLVTVEDKVFKLHKIILAQSPYLKQLLLEADNQGQTKELTLTNISKHTFAAIAEYLYINVVESIHSMSIYDVFLLFETARTYLLPHLMTLCGSYLFIKANHQNVQDVLLFASRSVELISLKKACMMYIMADSKLMKLHGVLTALHENYNLHTEYKAQKKAFKKQVEAHEKDLKHIRKDTKKLLPSSAPLGSVLGTSMLSRVPSLPHIVAVNTTPAPSNKSRRHSVSHQLFNTNPRRNTSRLRYAHSTWANYQENA